MHEYAWMFAFFSLSIFHIVITIAAAATAAAAAATAVDMVEFLSVIFSYSYSKLVWSSY